MFVLLLAATCYCLCCCCCCLFRRWTTRTCGTAPTSPIQARVCYCSTTACTSVWNQKTPCGAPRQSSGWMSSLLMLEFSMTIKFPSASPNFPNNHCYSDGATRWAQNPGVPRESVYPCLHAHACMHIFSCIHACKCMHVCMHARKHARIYASMGNNCMCALGPLQLSYEVALGFSPLGGPINVAMEAPVGVVIEPPLLTFNEENWEKAQRLQLRVTSLFPAAPMVSSLRKCSADACTPLGSCRTEHATSSSCCCSTSNAVAPAIS